MLAAALLVAQYTGIVDASVNGRVVLRSSKPAPIVTTTSGVTGEDVIAMDFAILPALRLRLNDHFWDFSIAYVPSFTAADVEIGYSPQILHSATTSVGWHDKFVRVSVSESVSYGVLNSAFLYGYGQQNPNGNAAALNNQMTGNGQTGQTGQTGQMGQTGQTGQTSQTGQTATGATQLQTQPNFANSIEYGANTTGATLSWQAGRRQNLTMSAGYSVNGALTAAGKQAITEQYGPIGTLAFSDALSRIDTAGMLVTAEDTTTSGPCPANPNPPANVGVPITNNLCVSQSPSYSLQATGRHAFSATSSFSLNLGVNASIADTLYFHELLIVPIVFATYALAPKGEGKTTLVASLGLIPTVDLRTGEPYTRGQGSLAYTSLIGPRRYMTLTATAIQSLPIGAPDPYPITSIAGSVDITSRLSTLFDLTYGLQGVWQDQSGYGTIVSASGYVGVTAKAPKARF